MSLLGALAAYYDRLPDIAEEGWAPVKFGWCIVLNSEGTVADIEDCRDLSGKKPKLREYLVPFSDKVASRTSGIEPNFFTDKSAYVLGRTAGEGKRTAKEHAAFRDMHLERLAGQNDEGLVALARFLDAWRPEMLEGLPHYSPDILDSNIMFRLEGLSQPFLHKRPAATELVRKYQSGGGDDEHEGFCLVSGQFGQIARLHRAIKGVENAQSSGAPLVSCNSTESPAFSSYGKGQGLLAPTSKSAAFRYTTALNLMLTRDGPNRVKRPIGDATVVFWADASNAEAAEAAEGLFGETLDPPEDADEARKIGQDLEAIAKGRAVSELRPAITPGTKFHVLGLSPNAARLSVRFWLTDDFEAFAKNLADHFDDMHIEPRPLGWSGAPSVNRLLAQTTALQGKFENIPALLAGEVMRSVLTGARYPQSWLAAAVIRLRAGDDPLSGWHVAAIRAVLCRDHRLNPKQEDVPVSLAPDEPNKAYQLGRLFAVLEAAQRMALGKINATIRDRYFGAASATPASVFPLLLRGVQNHLGRLRKDGKGGWIEREIEDILDKLTLDLPRALPLAEQGRFAVGYYHQRKQQFKGRPDVDGDVETHENGDAE